jgi:hypothetical protein
MHGRLTRKDYETILRHYGVPFKSGDKLKKVRASAEEILREKLCRCIKRVKDRKHPDGEKRAIPICKKSILHRRKVTDSGFSCKKKTIRLRSRGGTRRKIHTRRSR